ncbi:hypothetical protein Mal4_27590 [Maioricimonas rarisocia]|uniref:DUF4149 domain-containing protein n=1 Tax=Maioricimonas rarisocia TaxID=2528026 RepID=A0A517Z7G9_9PLAN|nr:hypothetical protein [Maioricimonas rarisocia]QDU38432.1 hypothetical protein Mal4_27590 [Maioricimonas rarisocia]
MRTDLPRYTILRSSALMLSRFCLSAWVGAAALFVVNGIRQVTSPDLDSYTIDLLVPLRFNAYYAFGFALVGAGLIFGLLASPLFSRARTILFTLLLVASLVLMGLDWFRIYQPLLAMITPPGQARPAAFQNLHYLSEIVNTVHVGLAFVAALTFSWPSATCWLHRGELDD